MKHSFRSKIVFSLFITLGFFTARHFISNDKVHLSLFKRAPSSSYQLIGLQNQYSSWGIKNSVEKGSINVLNAWKIFQKKKEITIAVVDTGVDPAHEFVRENIYSAKGEQSFNAFGVDSSSVIEGKTPLDKHGHGTNIIGIIKSIFPEVKIIPISYFSPGATPVEMARASLRAFKKAVDLGVDIINYSGGGPGDSLEELQTLKEAEKKGIVIITAAGNEASNTDFSANAYYPASYRLSNMISVGAFGLQYKDTSAFKDRLSLILNGEVSGLKKLPSSNWGSKSVDIFAPGEDILGPYPSIQNYFSLNQEGSRKVANNSVLTSKQVAFMTGTSQATAFVTGVAALLKSQFPLLSPQAIKKIILDSAHKESFLKGQCLTEGRLDAAKALELAKKQNPSLEIAVK